MELAVVFLDRQVVDAREAALHQAILSEFPVFVAIGTEPVAGVVVPFVGIADRNAVFGKSPELLDQAVLEFLVPFACQELPGFLPAVGEFGTVTPLGVERI